MTVRAEVPHRASRELSDALLEVVGGAVRAVLLYGSQLVGTSPDPHSAHDLVVVVDDYRRFYETLAEAGHHRRSPRLLTGLARVLPPNVIAFFPSGPAGPVAKIMVLSAEHFRRALSSEARDHFLKGRMVQRVAVLHARSSNVRHELEEHLAAARREVLDWAGPFVEQPFTAQELARTMLRVSYRGEVRPEAADRVDEVFEAQRDFLAGAFREVLEGAETEGRVERMGRAWRFTSAPGASDRWRVRLYFLRSKARATLRWFKHILTFDDWLTYIQRKVERRTGMSLEITPLERRYPLIFLWPKVVRVLAARPEQGSGDGEGGRS